MYHKRLSDGKLVLRLERGEDPMECISKVANEEGIGGAIVGIGAVEWAEVGIFDMQKRQYLRKRFDERMELLALVGNVAYKDGEAFVHVHVCLGKSDFSVVGGHLFAASISATCEIVVFPWQKDDLKRGYDEEINMTLWKL